MSDLIVGVDVSAHQPPDEIDWEAFRAAGVRYAILKAAEGIGGALYKADEHAARAEAAGVLVGYYAFMRPRLPKYNAELAQGNDVKAAARAQAEQFLDNVSALPYPSMGLWADIEVVDPKKELTAHQLADFLEEFCVRCAISGLPVGIYSGYYFLRDTLTTDALRERGLERFPLWIPWYHGSATGPKRTPAPWTDWDIHQWTEKGNLPGYDGPLDLNVAKRESVTKILKSHPGMRILPGWAQDLLVPTV
jgi:lysozyme